MGFSRGPFQAILLRRAVHSRTSLLTERRWRPPRQGRMYLTCMDMPQVASKLAMVDCHGGYTYGNLLRHTCALKHEMVSLAGPLEGRHVAYLCPHDASYVITQNAVWAGLGTAVPLSPKHPTSLISYFLEDSGADLVVVHEDYQDLVEVPTAAELLVLQGKKYLPSHPHEGQAADPAGTLEDLEALQRREVQTRDEQPALIVYTSGTTGPPKGVVHTQGALQAMVADQVSAWGWTRNDRLLHVLPLHHVHGIVNTLNVPLSVGATCVMPAAFQPQETWQLLLAAHPWLKHLDGAPLNLFMAVPTIYVQLLAHMPQEVSVRSVLQKNFRLMVSGSAALPVPVLQRWEAVSGHRLLERYGMTETGMVLTNPLHGQRIPGPPRDSSEEYESLVMGSHQGTTVSPGEPDRPLVGELLVKGPTVFREYWGKPGPTAEGFTADGWFRTGDTASYADGVFRILGRTSVDIIKTAGFKVSALDVERHLLAHPDIADVAVVGLADEMYGQRVAAAVVLQEGCGPLSLDDLQHFLSDKLARYQMPRELRVLDALPRSLIGKVNKKDLAKQVFG